MAKVKPSVNEYLTLNKSNCKNCYRCIRNCPVKSIRFSGDHADIVADECILCGRCFAACPQNAKKIRDDLPAAKALLAGDAPVVASVAPSFVASYGGATFAAMKKVLLALGFNDAEETAIGATMVKNQYDDAIAKRPVTISSCCHSVNLLIQRYYPDALPCLAHVLSPMQAHSKDIKRRMPDAKTIFIGPCISKKAEAEAYPGMVDCVLTFAELSDWLHGERIALEDVTEDSPEGRARFFPITGGILKTMKADNPDYSYIAVDGMENCIQALQDVVAGKLGKCFIEMSACEGSCICGPATCESKHAPIRDQIRINKYAREADFQAHHYSSTELHKDMPSLAPHRVHYGHEAIEAVLRKIGKTAPEHELNCGGCGYNTCREKAEAVLAGKANLNMCLPYLSEKAKSFSDQIIRNTPNAILVLNEELELQQLNCAARVLMNIKKDEDLQGTPVVNLLDPQPFIELCEGDRTTYESRLYLPEYRKHVDQTIVRDKANNIIICFMRDITEEVKQREQREAIGRATVETADKVIEKQMRSVQEIASLLGETAAETQVALTQLKEALHDE